MKKISRVVLHILVGLFLCGSLYNLLVMPDVGRGDAWGWLNILALLVGFTGLCIPREKFHLIGATTSVIFGLSYAFQMLRFMLRFSGPGWAFSSFFGPWEFHGFLGHVVLWGLPALVIVSGVTFIACCPSQDDESMIEGE